jgi:N-dimethylarginine dimethylaminohydrolase
MCPPTFFDVREVKNPHMRLPIDHVLAQQQWENLRRALEDAGVQVESIPPVKHLEDMVFAANPVFVGQSEKTGKFIVPSEMRYLIRQREVAYYVEWFRAHGYQVIAIDLKGQCLEGHGDLVWHPDHSKIWAGYGFRSTLRGVEKFAQAMENLGFPVIPLRLVDEHCYHLDTCFCPLSSDALLVYPGAFSPEALEVICRQWSRVHELSRDEALGFMANGIVANGHYITPRLTPNLANILEQENLRPVVVDTSEFEKSGGSAFCMKCVLE